MSQRCVVLIAATDLMPKLKERTAEPGGELLTFSDTDALRALEAILKRKPNVVALEQRFSATARGTALINRIKADPSLTKAEIWLLSQDGTRSSMVADQPSAAPAEAGKAAPATSAGAPAVDVWNSTVPRRVDMAPAAPVVSAPPAPSKVTVPPAPVIDDRRIASEAPVEWVDLAVEFGSAAIEVPADWIEETVDTKASPAVAPAAGKTPGGYEVISNAGEAVAQAKPAAPPAAPPAPPAGAQPLDQTGTRGAPRFKVNDSAGLVLDGTAAKLVDLSTNGAQVLSSAVLKPNQRVRLALTDKQGSVKINGSVVWALFEIPPRYRAGIAFLDADPAAVDTFCGRHSQS